MTARRANRFVLSEYTLAYVKPSQAKYSTSVFRKLMLISLPSRLHQRGVSRSSRTWEAGCDGRCGARDERAEAYGEIVRSRSPDAGIKSCGAMRKATAANKPGTPRRSRISRKTIARGMPDCFGCPVVACVRRVHTFFARKARGCGQHPVFPAPSDLSRAMLQYHSGISCRGNAQSRPSLSCPGCCAARWRCAADPGPIDRRDRGGGCRPCGASP